MIRILFVVVVSLVAGILISEFWLSAPPTSSMPETELRPSINVEEEYLHGTEELGEGEARIIALGTGFPFARRAQAASSWLVELGNGDKFIFDLGLGAVANFNGMGLRFPEITGLFFSHLHVDHVGDLDAYWVARFASGSVEPLHVWGPSGHEANLGTNHFVEHFLETYRWDSVSRSSLISAAGGKVVAHEFDYSKVHVVYDNNGVKITAFPAIHVIDGAVGYRLEWQGRSVVYGGDTTQGKWLVENGQNADVVIHETFLPPGNMDQIPENAGFNMKAMIRVGMFGHTTPAAAGKVFGLTRPRLAVGFHHLDNEHLLAKVEAEVRANYDGPLLLSQDGMVINITDENIRVRQGIIDDRPLPVISDLGEEGVKKIYYEAPGHFSDWLAQGRIDYGTLGMPNPGGVRGLAMEQIFKVLMKQYPEGVDPDELKRELGLEDSGEATR